MTYERFGLLCTQLPPGEVGHVCLQKCRVVDLYVNFFFALSFVCKNWEDLLHVLSAHLNIIIFI